MAEPARGTTVDHCVIHITNWERSNAFYRDVLGAQIIEQDRRVAYRFGDQQLNVHGPGVTPGAGCAYPGRAREQ